jgi:hypothetical protein
MTVTISDIDIISLNNNLLEINYLCKTKQVSYCIADFGGNVLKRGNYNCLEENRLAIDCLPKGFYTLCIIDGDDLTKSRFLKD